MSKILSSCIEFEEQRKICVAKESGKKYELVNQSKYIIRKIKVDNCLTGIMGEKRCDYLMNTNNEHFKRVYFIELKGGKLLDACEQIFETIVLLKEEFPGFRMEARIVGGKDVPNMKSDPKYKILAREIVKAEGSIKISTTKFYSESI